MRPGGCFGVVLHGKGRQALVLKTLNGVVIKVDMSLYSLVIDATGFYGETMIL